MANPKEKKKIDKPKPNIFKRIATTPDRSSYIWKDGQPSILATILLWIVWVFRLLSLLQICKTIKRLLVEIHEEHTKKKKKEYEAKLSSGTLTEEQKLKYEHKLKRKVDILDKGSTRVNIPPRFPEIYYLVWLGVVMLIYFINPQINWIKNICVVLTIYYLFESVVWIAYYTIFRRFFEEKYALYHSLENLVLLILLFFTQMFAFTYLLQFIPDASEKTNTLIQNLLGLLGAGWDETYWCVKLCGAFNSAIVIGMIITNFPSEKTKSEIDDENFIIIGNGDVVKERLRPALERAKFKERYINTYDLNDKKSSNKYVHNYDSEEKIIKKVMKVTNGKTVIFISSPSYTHYDYLLNLNNTNCKLLVVEKPIESNFDNLNKIYDTLINDYDKREKLFFLSYYLLEKALPLTYLVKKEEAYKKYLYISDETLVDTALDKLGKVTSIEVVINEKKDTRHWVNNKEYGGQLVETFIHNVLIASLFVGDPNNWDSNRQLNISDDYSSIDLLTSLGDTKIHLHQSKGQGQENREARITFENGVIIADFDNETASIKFNDGKELKIVVTNAFKDKYDVQVDLVRRVYDEECNARDVDGLYLQVETIKWLLKLNDEYFGIERNK